MADGTSTRDLLGREEARRQTALAIASDLALVEAWQRFGDPVIVGAVAHGLVVAPDIDMEVYCQEPTVAEGFSLLSRWAEHPRVFRALFLNALDTPDLGLYWQLRYRHHSGEEWKVDMWSVRRDHPGPLGKDLVQPLAQALTTETRAAILLLKEELRASGREDVRSIDLYQAVLDGGVRGVRQLDRWLLDRPRRGLVDWRPKSGAPTL